MTDRRARRSPASSTARSSPTTGSCTSRPRRSPPTPRSGSTDRQMGYFASRAAPWAPVPAEVVIATFFNFAPAEVRRCIPAAWAIASPAAAAGGPAAPASTARCAASWATRVDGPEVAEAAEPGPHRQPRPARPEGRPLLRRPRRRCRGPTRPTCVLWHALTPAARAPGRRPHRLPGGRGRRRLRGARAARAPWARCRPPILQASRARTDEEWAAAVEAAAGTGAGSTPTGP